MKSNDNASHLIGMDGQSNVKFTIGSTPFNDNGMITPVVTNFTRDGAWHEMEIPMTTLKQMGLSYSSNNTTGKNVFWFLSGGVSGVKLEMDAVFIYEKTVNTGIKDLSLPANFIVTGKTISLLNATGPIELYNSAGVKVRSSHESILGIEDLAKGIYIVRSGSSSMKVKL